MSMHILLAAVAFTRGSTAQDPPATWTHQRVGKASYAKWNHTWQMNQSTILYTCNFSGYIEPEAIKDWGWVQLDWSNGLEDWSMAKPMNTDENALTQIKMLKAVNPKQKHSVYRNSQYCISSYSECRKLLDDPAYAPWFVKFKPEPFKTYRSRCSNLSGKELCSDYYHFEDWGWGRGIPNYPDNDSTGYGRCTAPGCDCGTKPCGMYVWNFSSDAEVHGQTFTDWFADTYVLGEIGGSPLVHGYYFDDGWNGYWNGKGCAMGDQNAEQSAHFAFDTGFTKQDCEAMLKSYQHVLSVATDKLLAAGKFSQCSAGCSGSAGLWNVYDLPSKPKNTKQCLKDLHYYCANDSSPQTDVIAYRYSQGSIHDTNQVPIHLEWDLTNFLLIRGPYNWLGFAYYPWQGPPGWCFGVPGLIPGSPKHPTFPVYYFPPEFNKDYGEPIGGQVCRETSDGSGVFRREWTKATVEIDCNTVTPTITMK